MQVTFLGTNGWYDTSIGNTISVLVQTNKYDIIFDAGNGIAKADQYITQEKPVYLFLSHLHLDHIAGLHTLLKFRLNKGLHVFTQKGTHEHLDTIISEPYTTPFAKLPFKVTVRELIEGFHRLPFSMECLPLKHPMPCFGYRLEIDGKTIAYCTDTLVCENVITLARDANLFITECGLKPGVSSPDWPHISPEDAIRMAREAQAKRLALVHFGPDVYPTLTDRKEIERKFVPQFPALIVTRDDMTIDI